MITLPLRLVGCNIYDADDRWIALLRGEMPEYRANGAQIIAAVNSRIDYAPLEMKYAGLLAAAKTLKSTIDIRLNNYLIEIKSDYDDSITGFNEAWDIVRAAVREFDAAIAKAEQA